MPQLVGYLLLFLAVGIGFILVHLLVGKLVRPSRPDAEKMTIYECGEPTIGSAWVQFDVRYYVVALLFVIFDVEVAFFFPWAVVFGKFTELARPDLSNERRIALTVGPPEDQPLVPPYEAYAKSRTQFREALAPGAPPEVAAQEIAKNRQAANQLALIAFLDILVFFGVLLVGFAFLWKRGDLDWVRSVAAEQASTGEAAPYRLAATGGSAGVAGAPSGRG